MFDSISHPQKRAFLAAYARLGNVTRAARIARISRELHYDWKAQDKDYAAAFEQAKILAGEALEDDAVRRARWGVRDYIVYRGEIVLQPLQPGDDPDAPRKPLKRRRYSDSLLAMLLKGAMPEKYRERFEHTGDLSIAIADRLAAGRKRVAKTGDDGNGS